jgi:hypothetical protein
MAAHGLCFACYRSNGRAQQHAERQVDRHNPAIRREHKKLFSAYGKLMGALSDIGLTRGDVMEVKQIIQPYLVPIQEYLNEVNSEQQESEFTVHNDDGPKHYEAETTSRRSGMALSRLRMDAKGIGAKVSVDTTPSERREDGSIIIDDSVPRLIVKHAGQEMRFHKEAEARRYIKSLPIEGRIHAENTKKDTRYFPA